MAQTFDVGRAETTPLTRTTPTAPAGTRSGITFLIYSPYPRYSGGRENWLYNLTGVLSRVGVPVTIFARASNRRPFYPAVDGVTVVLLWSIRYLDEAFFWFNRATLGLARLIDMLIVYPLTAAIRLRREKPDVLVCMNSVPEGLAAVIARRRFVVSVRGDVPSEMRPRWLLERPMRALERRVLRRATGVLANGFDTQARLTTEGIESVVVPNGVDLDRFRSVPTDDVEVEPLITAAHGRPVIAVVGTMRPIKGTDEAIACAAELKSVAADFLMALVGKGQEAHYRRVVHAAGVEDVVAVLGEMKDVPGVLRHTDIFLALSGGSGMSMAVLEAMAAALPIVALDTPVYRQLITHGVNGLLATPPDVALACRRLLRDADLRKQLGAAAAKSADPYGWDRVAATFLRELAATAAVPVPA